ncbi:putative serine/threonine-protein kinase [Heracleum sosnowskyi]|uniref:Serine/threonine-protein kinase n=1 Tax=Heracleum sosnowskyi TaxID=360622 RepID=A0AAD8JHZ6_9APIA|nr:putative serine/threonine-protein kinase [Heracleum sosnowskyi]
MGCVQTNGMQYTPPRSLEKRKTEYGYVEGDSGGRSNSQKVAEKGDLNGGDQKNIGGTRKIVKEGEEENSNEIGNVSEMNVVKKIGSDELIDGWPKWLVDNLPSDVLATFVPKSADSYDKIAKIGRGTYSNVYKALDRDTGKIVALKKSDLSKVISRPEGRLTEQQVKCYMQQLLLELLLGSKDYGVGIDLWSAGCLLAEMFMGKPIMPGRTEVEQLHRIFKLCGSPTEDYWKKLKPPTNFRPPSQYKPSFHEAFGSLPDSAMALLPALLSLEPVYRGTAASALQNEFFTSSSLACDLGDLPIMNKDDDVLPPATHSKKSRSIKKRQQTPRFQGHESKNSGTDDTKDTPESSIEEEASSEMAVSNRESPPSLPCPPPHLDLKRSATSEAHPNALKNIKNFPLLMASITETVNHIENHRINRLHRRSMSTVDFRTLDMEKVSKLFGVDDH